VHCSRWTHFLILDPCVPFNLKVTDRSADDHPNVRCDGCKTNPLPGDAELQSARAYICAINITDACLIVGCLASFRHAVPLLGLPEQRLVQSLPLQTRRWSVECAFKLHLPLYYCMHAHLVVSSCAMHACTCLQVIVTSATTHATLWLW